MTLSHCDYCRKNCEAKREDSATRLKAAMRAADRDRDGALSYEDFSDTSHITWYTIKQEGNARLDKAL